MNGFINILKPPGPSSHDVVNAVRRLLKTKKVGHAGTLDPEAAGVLVLGVGQATRLLEYIQEGNKNYRAEITFGVVTVTQDQEGEVLQRKAAGNLTVKMIEEDLADFRGSLFQIPPSYSALKYRGTPLYSLARKGQHIQLEPREVRVYQVDLLKFYPDRNYPKVLIDIECSKGTYIRTIAQDLGDKLGCGAHLSGLIRTGVGSFKLEHAFTLEELDFLLDREDMSFLQSLGKGMEELPQLVVSSSEQCKVLNGISLGCKDQVPLNSYVRVLNRAGQLLAIGEAIMVDQAVTIKMRKVFK